ncbi:unnamed protein product [Eruca vesicaria subsp. sativa]|uniref:Uncharacterized protein n=1 Tax=Eruca vesicaria subsp. sativa TaxID=29727 RepID=A0ABC8M6P6_ERUVS|nr:unnamed protein product [Eruca vesicaria subsp. sativa]
MEDLSLEKIEIQGPTLASLIQRASSSPCDVDGLLFGQIHRIVSTTLSDDSPATSSSSTDQIVATVTSFISSGKTVSFYDPLGRVDSLRVDSLRVNSPDHLLGWFSARRTSPNRPSMRELTVSSSLSSRFQLPIENSVNPNSASSSVFILLTTPLTDQLIHTHEYRAYQFKPLNRRLEPRSLGIVNIGPAFRGHYGSFNPKSGFPELLCEVSSGSSAMNEDRDDEGSSLSGKKQAVKDQKEVDALADGFQVGSLKRLVGVEAASFTGGIEEMYERMLAKVESLASEVEKSSAKVLELDNHNRKLRYRVARIER